MKSVFQFSSCQDYVRSVFENEKKSNPKLSILAFATRMGLGQSTLKMVLTGKRKLSVTNALQLARMLKLSFTETEYLQSLALQANAKASGEKIYFARKIKTLKKDAKLSTFPLSKSGILADPYTLPILVYLTDFTSAKNEDASLRDLEITKIAQRFQISPERVSKALELLHSLGAVQKREGTTEVHYVFSKFLQVMSQQHYLKSWLAESSKRVDSEYRDPHSFFHTSILSIDENQLPNLIQDFKAVLEKYISLPLGDEKTIITGNIQLFPILK